jgi:hypothetical protein
VLELTHASVQRAIDVLRGGPMRASEFARRMWPERAHERTEGQNSQAGSAYLHRLASVGYVERVGDLWMLRSAGSSVGLGNSPFETPVGTAVGLPFGSPVEPPFGSPFGSPDRLPAEPPLGPAWDESRPAGFDVWEADPAARLRRLRWLVGRATEPHPTGKRSGVGLSA